MIKSSAGRVSKTRISFFGGLFEAAWHHYIIVPLMQKLYGNGIAANVKKTRTGNSFKGINCSFTGLPAVGSVVGVLDSRLVAG